MSDQSRAHIYHIHDCYAPKLFLCLSLTPWLELAHSYILLKCNCYAQEKAQRRASPVRGRVKVDLKFGLAKSFKTTLKVRIIEMVRNF